MHFVGVGLLFYFKEVGKGWCVYLFLFQFTDSTQTLSVYVGSRKLKGLRAEEVFPLRTGCPCLHLLSLPVSRSHENMCLLYILHFYCYNIKVILFYLFHFSNFILRLLIHSLPYAALSRWYLTWIIKEKKTMDIQEICLSSGIDTQAEGKQKD